MVKVTFNFEAKNHQLQKQTRATQTLELLSTFSDGLSLRKFEKQRICNSGLIGDSLEIAI